MFHTQRSVNGILEAVARAPAGALFKAFEVQLLAAAKATNSGINTLHRHWNDPYQNVNPTDTEDIREQRARGWFEQFIDGTFLNGSTAGLNHAAATDMVSFFNEYYAQSQSAAEKELWWEQERTAARIWRDEYRNGPDAARLGHIRLAIGAAAVGNDLPWQSAQTAAMYDAVLDYHPYDWFQNGQRHPDSWQYQSGRWATMDANYRNRGFTVDWVFGEAGPYATAIDGWKHPNVCGGDINKYVEAVRVWIQDVKGTPAYQQGRILGYALFTTGGTSQWGSFETRQPELNALADMLAQEWTPVQAPLPPVDPLPGLMLHAPLDTVAYVTSRFNDPRSYGLHEGLDFAPAPGVTAKVLAADDGTVVFVGNRGGGYGNYVKSQHVYNEVLYIVYFAHLASIAVSVGDSVEAGDVIGIAGDTGNSTGVHCHITLRVPGYGLPGYVVADVIDPEPYYAIVDDKVQPTPAPNDPCKPRTPYARVMVVVPQWATVSQYASVAYRYYDRRYTIGFSYDDAGFAPGLISKTAILLGIPEGERQEFIDWYANHYPGTVVQFAPL